MNTDILIIIGMVDYILDVVKVPESDFYATRTYLLGTIYTKLLNKTTANLGSDEKIESMADFFTKVNAMGIDINKELNEMTVSVLSEFVTKTVDNPKEILTVIENLTKV